MALRRWVDEDLELSAALRWAATYSPRIEFLLDAEWEAGRLSGQGGYVVTVRFNDRSFARTRVADARSPLVPRRLSVDLYLTTTHLLPAQANADQAALAALVGQIGLMKAAALMSDEVRLHAPPEEDFDERSWVIFGSGSTGLGWNVGPRDPELVGSLLAQESRFLLPADMAELVALRTDVQLLRAAGLIELDTDEPTYFIRTKAPTTLVPATPSLDDLANAEARRIQRSSKLAAATVIPTVLDAVSADSLQVVLRDKRHAVHAVHTSTLEQQVVGLSAMYATTVVPQIMDCSSEQVLNWRVELGESLGAFHERVRELLIDSSSADASDATEYMKRIGPQLDRDFSELRRQARSSRLWQTTREHSPVAVGLGAGFGLQLMAAGKPLLAASALLQGTVTQALVNVAEALRRQRATRGHALYWRHVIAQER